MLPLRKDDLETDEPGFKLSLWPAQMRWFFSLATELLVGGAAGPGKSHFIRVAAIFWAIAIPGIQIYFFRRTFPDLEKNHFLGPGKFPDLLASLIEAGLCRINWTKLSVEFTNGSRIIGCHLATKKDLANYLGPDIHLLIIDELTAFTEAEYRFLRGRVRLGGLKVPAVFRHLFPRIIAGTNPGSIGHAWVKQFFVTPGALRGGRPWRTGPDDGRMIRQFMPALLGDNPSMEKEYADKLRGMGTKELVEAMLHGNWDIVAGAMFADCFSPASRLKPFRFPLQWPVYRAMDWGTRRPFSIGWWGISPGEECIVDFDFTGAIAKPVTRFFPQGSMIRIAEYYGCERNGSGGVIENKGVMLPAPAVAADIIEREEYLQKIHKGLTILAGPADSQIWAVIDGESTGDRFSDAGVEFVSANKGPGSRVARWEKMRQMYIAARDDPYESAGLYHFSSCKQYERVIPSMICKENKPDDIDSDQEDHIADEAGYMVLFEQREAQVIRITGT